MDVKTKFAVNMNGVDSDIVKTELCSLLQVEPDNMKFTSARALEEQSTSANVEITWPGRNIVSMNNTKKLLRSVALGEASNSNIKELTCSIETMSKIN